ncbi:hypothetical protein AMJ40_04370 [candidate division TA06 bacterium DG_26]|uniref:Uncharacterized protein n=1 Tax=candidate division TA06 bacterium DG_26 TaxID=1703771 RepID=A0A0S7WIQ6_UNCT6|nr:MAG: hypothetical protein AMJ40_04370 [candidate division TA06 bacterium DG_26]
MSVLNWLRTKLYVGFKKLIMRNRPVCASQILTSPEGVLIVLPTRDEELGSVARHVRGWTSGGRRTLVISSFHSASGTTICCDSLLPFGKEFYSLKDSLHPHPIDLLVDLNERTSDRSRMIAVLSGAPLRVACFDDPPFFNCQVRIEKSTPGRGTELLRTLEDCFSEQCQEKTTAS